MVRSTRKIRATLIILAACGALALGCRNRIIPASIALADDAARSRDLAVLQDVQFLELETSHLPNRPTEIELSFVTCVPTLPSDWDVRSEVRVRTDNTKIALLTFVPKRTIDCAASPNPQDGALGDGGRVTFGPEDLELLKDHKIVIMNPSGPALIFKPLD